MNTRTPLFARLLCGLALLAATLASPAQAKRVALLIGNATYSVGALTNPPNDVREIQAALKAVGFDDIRVLQDADQKAMKKAIRDFGDKAEGADLAFVYYSGHGTQANGRNYLIPINASIDKESDYEIEAVAANGVLEQIAGARPKAAVVVLDACRDNPVATARSGTKGLSRMDAPTGTMIAFSTAPNKTASDEGYYARVLAQQIRSPGLELLDVFRRTTAEVRRLSQGRQEPRVSEVSISDAVYFGNRQVVSVDPIAMQSGLRGPAGSAANFGDLEQAQKEEAATRKKWAEWQARMKADFNKAAGFSGSAALEAKAWERYLTAYAEDNPYSEEDEQLRTDAGRKQVAAQARAADAARSAQARAAAIAGVGGVFKECDLCPEMVVLPMGRFTMGSPDSEAGRDKDEGPQHEVTINYKLAVGKFAVTFDEWQACVNGGGCTSKPNPSDGGWGRGKRPVINVSWNDAQEYVQWLKSKTGSAYRLLSEAEWEYAARGGRSTLYFWGEDTEHTAQCAHANGADDAVKQVQGASVLRFASCNDGFAYTAPVGSFKPNAFGLYDMAGNVLQWVGDAYHQNYRGAPSDGSAWIDGGDDSRRVTRGGSWDLQPTRLRSAYRDGEGSAGSSGNIGFRIARTE